MPCQIKSGLDSLKRVVTTEIFKLVNLKELEIHGNSFSSLPKELSQLLNLEKIEINQEHLSLLPKDIFKIKGLTVHIHDSEEIYNIEAKDIRKNLAISRIVSEP